MIRMLVAYDDIVDVRYIILGSCVVAGVCKEADTIDVYDETAVAELGDLHGESIAERSLVFFIIYT